LISATVDLALLVEFLMVQSVGFGFVKSSLWFFGWMYGFWRRVKISDIIGFFDG
jgi:hypothetical protein